MQKITQYLLILPKNVDKAIELLENRSGHTEYIIFLLLNRVRKFPTVKDDNLEM